MKVIAFLEIIRWIVEYTNLPMSALFPIQTGTSAGELALCDIDKAEKHSNASPVEAIDGANKDFIELSPKIFEHHWYGSIKKFFKYEYSQKPLMGALDEQLGNTRLGDTKAHIMIAATDLASQDKGIKIFDSQDNYSKHIETKDVLLATTAAPRYFKPVTNKEHIKSYENQEKVLYAYADGGLGANRPAYEALKVLKKDHTREENTEILDKTMVLTFNFVEETDSVPNTNFDGILGWLLKGKIIERLMRHNEDNSTETVRSDLFGEGEFVEIKIPISQELSKLDNNSPENIAALRAVGRKYIEERTGQLQKLCDNLVKYVEVGTKATTHEGAAEDVEIAIAECLDLYSNSDDDIIVNKEAIAVTSDDIANSNEDAKKEEIEGSTLIQAQCANKGVADDIESNSIITNENREQILDGIKQHLTSFANDNPDLKANIDQYLTAVNDYSNQELEEIVLDFAEGKKVVKEMELREAESVLAPYMS